VDSGIYHFIGGIGEKDLLIPCELGDGGNFSIMSGTLS